MLTRTPLRRPQAAGFTLIELLVVVAIVAVVSALAMAGYRHMRSSAGEAIAAATLQTINQAQFAFAQTCGDQRYSPTLAGLAVPAPTTKSAFISPDLAADPVDKSGYRFVMAGTPDPDARQSCNGLAPVAAYQVTADPLVPGVRGTFFFGTNADRVIYYDTASFAGNMPERGAPGHGSEVKK